ncbi:glycerophosphodiester phosphodiesterase family protein [Lutibaculum baratangense]|uniref:glycerophosphodiester phosphodiesterase n=1 Tax=Lutibaculum baratangense AMV1 TaxID=631454 RepID=V4TJL6_9HYPH|nr:glycerophosphodiester phosphodiesterase family protein [Lutibaculum baratangense]ESR26098.1 Glycerophosphoryl diester phosphodiesterase [Lutibaculum baratangense AMV1]
MCAKGTLVSLIALVSVAGPALAAEIEVGPRPYYLIDRMQDGELKEKLQACANEPVKRTLFSIAHRGAPLMFPEHTEESYRAGFRMGAGIVECDVTFTKDKELVCRHAQNDLHTSTNILATPLAETCVQSFEPAADGQDAKAECRTSELTLAEFRELQGKMDGADKGATSVEAYMDGNPAWRTQSYAGEGGRLLSHKESIELFKSLGAKFTPELKAPSVEMPFDGFTQADYAQKMIDEYKEAGVPPEDVWPQSFVLDDVLYWIENEPEFGRQAVFLDERNDTEGLDPMDPETFRPSMQELKDMGVTYVAPPIWMLLTVENGEIVPSPYANAAKEAGLRIITWSLERSGPLATGGGWYYQSMSDVIDSDGMMYEVVDALAQDVGVVGIFSDWPATVSYYASCMGLE